MWKLCIRKGRRLAIRGGGASLLGGRSGRSGIGSEVRTPHFILLSNTDARRARNVALEFEQGARAIPSRHFARRWTGHRASGRSSSPSETELICGCFSPDSRASFPSVCFVAHPISTALRFGWMNRRSNAFTRSITSTTIFFFTPRWRARRFGSRKGSQSSGRQWKRDVTGAWRSGVPTRVIFERFGSDR